jgi:NAD(P)H-dependent flavin oxidoreductase YrpB (nitropropane dioxygenase family)
MIKHLAGVLMLGASLFSAGTFFAPAADAQATQAAQPVASKEADSSIDQEIAMMRSDLRSNRKQVIAANMKLSEAEAEKFWPIYDQYVNELVKINDAKYALIKEYLQSSNLSDAQADTLSKRWLDVDASVAQLRLKFIPIFRKALSAKGTAMFYQIDRRVQMMIDLQLASAIPLIQP